MNITFYGVRGSMPVSGTDKCIVGGHTSCVYVSLINGDSIILDSGTGIATLGNSLMNCDKPIHILLTHNHWDHIQGFPFFKPIYQQNRDISIIIGDIEGDDKDAIIKQMSGSTHPVKYNTLPSNITLNTIIAKQKKFSVSSFEVTTQPLTHPDGGTAYCLHGDGYKIAYVTDNELSPPGKSVTSWQEWLKFIEGTDLLIHDAQYTKQDMPLKQGWGHSTVNQVVELAIEAKVKQLYLISHDPERTDQELLAIEASMQSQYGDKLFIACAREGDKINLATDL